MKTWKITFAVPVLALLLAASPFSAKSVFAEEEAHHAHTASHEADHHDQSAGSEKPNPLAFGPDLAIFSAVIFLLLIAILGKFAWPEIVAALEQREKGIADNIAAAEAKHQEAKQLLAEHEAKLAEAANEVRALLEEARRDAEHTKGQIVAEAKKGAEAERDRAVREIEQAKVAAMQDLAVTSANLAIDLARKVVSEQLNPEQQSRIVNEALSRLAVAKPSNN